MGYYQVRWEERKSFLLSSTIIGVVLSILFIIWAVSSTPITSVGEVGQVALVFIVLSLFFTAIVAVGRMVFGHGGTGEGFAINIASGFWTAIINAFTGSTIGIAIGVFMMMIFIFLFAIVAGVYAIYLPVSSIYFFIRYKQEIASNGSVSSTEVEREATE